jgi:glutamate formiminotransferase/formiminotetrahydrofolate cyclodeaminase
MRVGQELFIPVYCYANAALHPDRQNLAVIRSGEYEGLAEKMLDPHWVPDFGPSTFNAKSGATVIGARDFLIAYNVNLDTTSVLIADEIARDVRESGRVYRHPKSGEIVRDAQGKPVRIPGSLKGVKAIGWYIEEFGCSQVSMNLTDIVATPIHIAFEEVRAKAKAYGVQVTGSELIGMIPLHAMLAAGLYFSELYHTSANHSTLELVRTAINHLGLDVLAPFDSHTRIIELALERWEKYPPTQSQTSTG